MYIFTTINSLTEDEVVTQAVTKFAKNLLMQKVQLNQNSSVNNDIANIRNFNENGFKGSLLPGLGDLIFLGDFSAEKLNVFARNFNNKFTELFPTEKNKIENLYLIDSQGSALQPQLVQNFVRVLHGFGFNNLKVYAPVITENDLGTETNLSPRKNPEVSPTQAGAGAKVKIGNSVAQHRKKQKQSKLEKNSVVDKSADEKVTSKNSQFKTTQATEVKSASASRVER